MPMPTTTHVEYVLCYVWQGDNYQTSPFKTLAEAHAGRIEMRRKGWNGVTVRPVNIFDTYKEK